MYRRLRLDHGALLRYVRWVWSLCGEGSEGRAGCTGVPRIAAALLRHISWVWKRYGRGCPRFVRGWQLNGQPQHDSQLYTSLPPARSHANCRPSALWYRQCRNCCLHMSPLPCVPCAGPLFCGATQVLFDGVPTYPDAGRCWEIVDKLKVWLGQHM